MSAFPDWFFAAWVRAFVFTQLVEAPVYRAGLRCSWLRALGASGFTHPIVWFGFFHPALPLTYNQRFAVAEGFALLGEAVYFALWMQFRSERTEPLRTVWLRALGWSFAANASSVVLGHLSRALFGLP